MAFEKLKSAPLIETICEFRFASSVPWDATIPGLIYKLVQAEFSVVSGPEAPAFEVEVDPQFGPTAVRRREPTRTRFHRPDKSALLQVDTRMLSVNHFAPYPGWEQGFRPLIFQALRVFREVLAEFELSRIGLRYVNRIALRPEDPDLDRYLTPVPRFRGKLERPVQNMFQRYELVHDAPPGTLIHQTGIVRSVQNTAFFLDLDFASHEVGHLRSDEEIAVWLEAAHACVIESFNDSITPELYEKFRRGN